MSEKSAFWGCFFFPDWKLGEGSDLPPCPVFIANLVKLKLEWINLLSLYDSPVDDRINACLNGVSKS